jgi:hypothetical protein
MGERVRGVGYGDGWSIIGKVRRIWAVWRNGVAWRSMIFGRIVKGGGSFVEKRLYRRSSAAGMGSPRLGSNHVSLAETSHSFPWLAPWS